MAEVASAFVSLVPSARGFGKGIQGQIGGDLDRVGRTSGVRFGNAMSTGLGSTAKRIFAPLAAAAAGIGIASFFKNAVKGASDLNESATKTAAIFGKATAQVEAFASQGAKVLGQTKQEVLDAAATFGTFGKAAGLAGPGLAKFSTGFATLSTDLSSFFNTSPEEAVLAIGAALRGESEPIRRYGVLLDDATLRQEALRLGLIKTTKQALTPQQKVLAAQAQIYKQTKDAQGDFIKTSGGLANQQRILSAQFKDLRSNLGRALLPTVTKFVSFLNNKMVPGARRLTSVLAPVARAVKVFFLALGGGSELNEFDGVLRRINNAAIRIRDVFGTIAKGVGVFFAALTGRSEMNEFDGTLRGINNGAIRLREGFQKVADFVQNTLAPAIKAGFDKVKAPLQATLDFVTQTLVPGVVTKFGEVRTAFSTMLDGVDFIGVGRNLFAAAQSWASDLINGVQVGLDSGDWSPLGKTIGEKVIQAIQGAVQVAGKIGAAIGDLLGKVKWVDIGVSLGKQVPSLLAGLAIGILNADFAGLLRGLGDHWFEAILAVLGVAFAPARLILGVGRLLARVPLVGPLLKWMFDGFANASKGIVGAAGAFARFVGNALLAGFRTVFPTVGGAFSTFVRNLPTYLRVLASEFKDSAVKAMGGLADGLAAGVFRVVANLGQIVAQILGYFVGAGTWLLAAGAAIVTGLITGIGDKLSDLWDKVDGIGEGIKNRLKDAMKFGSPSKVTMEMGGWIAQGLAQGMEGSLGTVERAASRLTAGARPMTPRLAGGDGAGLIGGTRGGVVVNIAEMRPLDYNDFTLQTMQRARLGARR